MTIKGAGHFLQEQKGEDKRMSPNTKLLTGLKDLMKSEFGGMAELLEGIPVVTTGGGDVAGGKTTSGEETSKSPVRKKAKGGSPKKKKGGLFGGTPPMGDATGKAKAGGDPFTTPTTTAGSGSSGSADPMPKGVPTFPTMGVPGATTKAKAKAAAEKPAAEKPANEAKSQAASVCPALARTPPLIACNGKT